MRKLRDDSVVCILEVEGWLRLFRVRIRGQRVTCQHC